MSTSDLDFPLIILPKRNVFELRAQRLSHLAQLHQSDWLAFLAKLADIQQQYWDECGDLSQDSNTGRFPFQASSLPENYQAITLQFLNIIKTDAPVSLQNIIDKISDDIEHYTLATFQQLSYPVAAENILIFALMQLWWTKAAYQMDSTNIKINDSCPLSQSEATLALIENKKGLRYQYSILTNIAWHQVRAKCTFCHTDKPVFQHKVADQDDKLYRAVYAECCPDCLHYLKVISQQEDAFAEPIADDIASVLLDILMADTEFSRGGLNPYILQ